MLYFAGQTASRSILIVINPTSFSGHKQLADSIEWITIHVSCHVIAQQVAS